MIDVSEHGSISENKNNQFTIPKDTPLSFNVCELSVSQDGGIKLMVDPDSLGGFITLDEVDAEHQDDGKCQVV